ncbi:hypothetical protein HHL26_23750 [Sphingobium sp. TB-6]|uniref:hypothetical protein n=1 Tax=Sphingobium sp. TB-6 TaxID=2728850 RepID=UPI00146A9DC3|nr:hypothetical protein [Sphingobium sp. TB-6]NML92017.1 hypothetical protein [Sphingobium sp. TB-6]
MVVMNSSQQEPGRAAKGKRSKEAAKQNSSTVAKSDWTEDDEAQLRNLLTRRRQAGYRKPSRDVGGQVLRVGSFNPNPNTVTASICAIVALNGTITRRALLAEMADTVFPHPKAQPKDPKWCQGWVAGTIRNGFLVLVADEQADQSPLTDTAAQTPVCVAVSDLKAGEV